MTPTGSIKQQAATHAVSVVLPKAELEAKLDEYWESVKDIIPDSLTNAAKKGGFRKATRQRIVKAAGGRREFYKAPLMEIVEEFLDKQPRQALAFNDVELREEQANNAEGDTVLTNCVITGLVYLEPEIRWKKKPGIDEPLVIPMIKEPPNLVEMLVQEELENKQHGSVILTPQPEDTLVEDGQVVVVSARSWAVAQDGTATQWDSGTFKMNKWLVDKEVIKQPEIHAGLLGMKANETKDLTFTLNERFGSDANKTIRLSLTVNGITKKSIPAIDDDLAKTNGFDTLVAFRESLTAAITQRLNAQRERVRRLSILNVLANPEVVEVDSLPFVWMAQKANQLYMEGRQYVQSETDLVSRFNGATCMSGTPVKDKATLMQFLAERAATELMQDLILRSWGRQKGVAGDTNLKRMGEFVKAVQEEINKVVKVEEIEPNLPTE